MIKIVHKLLLVLSILSIANAADTNPLTDIPNSSLNSVLPPDQQVNAEPKSVLGDVNTLDKTSIAPVATDGSSEIEKTSEKKLEIIDTHIDKTEGVSVSDNLTKQSNMKDKTDANNTTSAVNPKANEKVGESSGKNVRNDDLKKKAAEIQALSSEVKDLVKKSLNQTENKAEPISPKVDKPKKADKITLNESFDISTDATTFTAGKIKPGQLYNLKIKGFNVVTVEIHDNLGNKLATHEIPLSGQEGGCTVPITSELLRDDFTMKVFTTQANLLICEANLHVVDYLEMDFNSNHYVVTFFVHEIHYKVKNPKKYAKLDKESRIQFIMQTSLDTQKLTGYEKVEMFINKSAKFPTEQNYELKASGSLGYGLIKSLSSRNPLYCIKDDCDYYVTIYVYNVEHIYFFPTIFANDSEINFNSYLFLIEEVEAGETVTYKLIVPKSQDDWLFSINPTEGNPDFYINPDYKPNKLSDYKYKAVGKGPENLLITYKESQSFGFTHEVFFVTYKSAVEDRAVTFKFEANKMENNKRIFVKEDHFSSGVVAKTEIVNYYMDLQNNFADTFSVNIDLESLSGNADLYVKECSIDDNSCAVTDSDISNARSGNLPAIYAGKIFRYSALDANLDSKKTDKIIVNVNCNGKNGPAKGYKPNPNYPNSRSCLFALGIHCRDANNKYGTLYRLVTYGNKFMETLAVFESSSIKVMADEKKNYEIDLNHYLSTHNSFAVFRVYTLTGSCNLFFSRTNDNPSSSDFETTLQVRTADINTLTTNTYTAYMDINSALPKKAIYLSVEGIEYCIFDIYVDLVRDIDEAMSSNERLRVNKMVHRGINKSNFVMHGKRKIFFNTFFMDIPYNLHHSKDLDISLDSDMIGLELCIQLNATNYDPQRTCDYESMSENLTINNTNNNLTAGRVIAITVLKYEDKVPQPVFFPIEFRLMVTIDNAEKNGSEFLTVGKSHTKRLNSSDSISYILNLTKMTNNGLVILTSESPSIDAVVTTSLKDINTPIAHLNYSKFAIRINNAVHFKSLHCKESSCELIVKITNSGLHKARFTLTYTVDSNPITIREGGHIYVPADREQYFMTRPNAFNPLSFNISTDKTSSVIYAQVFSDDDVREYGFTKLFSENKFDFKSHIDTEAQIIINPDVVEHRNASIIGYLVVPKFDVSTHYDSIIHYDQADKMSVNLHSNMNKLDSSSQLSGHINKGDFKYYYIHIDEPKDFNIILTVHSGEADLYINPGMYNLTTTQYYWKKRTSYKDDELSITKEMFKNPVDMIGTYTIGVYAREYSQFSIRYTQNEFSIIKLHYQRMIDVSLEKNKYYYFDFYNKHAKFNSILYAEGSDVEVSVLNYDERHNQNFLDMIDNDTNYIQKFTFKKGDVPRKKVSTAILEEQSHYIIRMKAIERDARVTFSIYDKTKPLMAYMERRFTFTQDENDEQIFIIKLDSNYREVDIDFKLDFGHVEFIIDDDVFFDKPSRKLDKPDQIYIKFTVDAVKKSNDIIVFKTIFIKVKALKFSKYSIFVKPVDKFKQLRALESELIYTDKETPQYLYYVIEKKDIKRIHSLVIDIYAVNYYVEKPELLFMSDADVTLNADSPFMPMPMLDYFENTSGRFTHYEIKPDISAGFYIVKIPTSSVILPLKISISINDEKIIEPNGIFSGRLDSSSRSMHKYTAYIPEAGEFRFLMESCSDIDIHKAIFTHSSNSTDIEFETRFVQSVPFLSVNSTTDTHNAQFKVAAYNIRRGIVNGPGLVRFNVTSANSFKSSKDVDYFIISEFRPAHKEIFMYDYVDLFFTQNETKSHKITYNFSEGKRPLSINAPVPHFRDQLLADYPSIKRVKIDFYYYLFVDNNFEAELSRCGIAAVNPYKKVYHIKTRFINVDDINKEDTFNFYFYPRDLQTFNNESRLTFFVSMGITFIESEEDEHHISLNNKYAHIPYFVLKIPNQTAKTSYFGLAIVLGAGLLILVFLFIILAKRFHNPDFEPISKTGYEKGTGGGNKLEMTSINRTTIED